MKNLILTFVFALTTLVSFTQDSTQVVLNSGDTTYINKILNFNLIGGSMQLFGSGWNGATGDEYYLDTISYDMNDYDNNKSFIKFIDTIFTHIQQTGLTIAQFDTIDVEYGELINHIDIDNNEDTITEISLDSINGIINNTLLDSISNHPETKIYLDIVIYYNDISGDFFTIPFRLELFNTEYLSVEEETMDVVNTNLYPNPVSSVLTIDFETENSDMPIEVYSMNGQLLESNNDYRNTFGTNTVKVNMSNFNRGVYIVRMGNVTKKVIKQ